MSAMLVNAYGGLVRIFAGETVFFKGGKGRVTSIASRVLTIRTTNGHTITLPESKCWVEK